MTLITIVRLPFSERGLYGRGRKKVFKTAYGEDSC